MIFAPGHNGSPAPVSQIVVGIFGVVLTLPVVVSMIKGYRLTVAEDRVVAHGLVNRVYPFAAIQSVEVVKAQARWAQSRTCLRFHLNDETSYTYKNFNGSLSPSSKSYANVVQAKDLIDQRIARLNRSRLDGIPPPPPPPPPPGASHPKPG
jgi:hypothetical protein